MAWDKIKIRNDQGELVDAQAPVIISASRSTDIPAFYSDWFFHRLEKGYSVWINPFNGVKSYVSYNNVRLIIFWSKNPKPLLPYLDRLKAKGINCYIQYTLNDYIKEKLEVGVPSVESRIETFKLLVEKLGKGKVIWRFDPLILTDAIDIDKLLNKVKYIGDELYGYTEKLVFSYADIGIYKKVKSNLEKNNIKYKEFSEKDILYLANSISKMNLKWGYSLATCCEKIPLEEYNILHNKCIDDDLMIKYFSDDKILMEFLGVKIQKEDLFSPERIIKNKNNKDKGQREFCDCIISKDIGEYNTCSHLCEYCYANASKEIALKNWKLHKQNPTNEKIKGE